MPLCSTKHTQVYFVLRKQRLWASIVQLDTLFSFLCTLGYTDMNCLVLTVASYVSYLLMSIRNPEQAMSFSLSPAFLEDRAPCGHEMMRRKCVSENRPRTPPIHARVANELHMRTSDRAISEENLRAT